MDHAMLWVVDASSCYKVVICYLCIFRTFEVNTTLHVQNRLLGETNGNPEKLLIRVNSFHPTVIFHRILFLPHKNVPDENLG